MTAAKNRKRAVVHSLLTPNCIAASFF